MARVYLAACFRRRDELRDVRFWLVCHGHEVTSRWLEVEEDQLHSADGPAWAQADVIDVLAADALVFFAEAPGAPGAGRGGRHVEFGMALVAGKRLIVVGEVENIFHRHPHVTVVRDVDGVVAELDKLSDGKE